jgi:hypothetical protein
MRNYWVLGQAVRVLANGPYRATDIYVRCVLLLQAEWK